MNAVVLAGVWAGAGLAMAGAARFARLRRAAVLVPIAGAVAALVLRAGPGHASVVLAQSGLTLDRAALGLLAAAGGSLAVVLLLAPRLDGRESATYGFVGAMVTLALATGSPVVWATVLIAAVAVLALRWIAAAPSRATLASARVPGTGSVALLAAAPFLPLVGVITGARPEIAAGLLGGGVAALLALVPLGGWAAGALSSMRGSEVAPWALLMAPSVLYVAERIPAATPAAGVDFGRILLFLGLVTAVYQAVLSLRPDPGRRYGRILLGDLGLAAAAIGAEHPAVALQGGLLILLTHMALAPVFLQGRPEVQPRLRTVAWAALSGVPPAPGFWARFLLLQALFQAGLSQAVAALLAAALLSLASLLSAYSAARAARAPQPRRAAGLVAWLAVGAAIALGFAPAAALSRVFGI